MNNWRETILAQYANSPTITAIIENFNDAVSPDLDIDQFFDRVWNIETAIGFGLDFWGKVVDIGRNLQVDQLDLNFGFNEAYTITPQNINVTPFNESPFYSGAPRTNTVPLGDEAYRRLILAKAMANISNCTAPSMNRALRVLYASQGEAYVKDLGNMEMQYVFRFEPNLIDLAILQQTNVMARPAAVSYTILVEMPGE